MSQNVARSNFSGNIHNLAVSFNMELKWKNFRLFRSLSIKILLDFSNFLDEVKGL